MDFFVDNQGNVFISIFSGVNNIKQLQPCFNEMQIKRVHFDGEELIWPVVFLYFMRNIFDYVQEFNENDRYIIDIPI